MPLNELRGVVVKAVRAPVVLAKYVSGADLIIDPTKRYHAIIEKRLELPVDEGLEAEVFVVGFFGLIGRNCMNATSVIMGLAYSGVLVKQPEPEDAFGAFGAAAIGYLSTGLFKLVSNTSISDLEQKITTVGHLPQHQT